MRPLRTLPLSDDVLSALSIAGYVTCDDILDGEEVITPEAGLIFNEHGYALDYIKKLFLAPPPVSAARLIRREAMLEPIPTFSEALDGILGGGASLGTLLQVCGPPGSGKTQFLLQLCVDVQLPDLVGGLEGEVIFIDSECSFSPTRLREIAQSACKHCGRLKSLNEIDEIINFNVDSILQGVHYIEVTSFQQLLASVHYLNTFVSSHTKVKLIVIDSLTFPLLAIKNTLERTRIASMIIGELQEIAEKYHISIVMSNDLTTRIKAGSTNLIPALGESVTHRIPETLLFGKIGPYHSAVFFKSHSRKDVIVHFSITKEGLRDIT